MSLAAIYWGIGLALAVTFCVRVPDRPSLSRTMLKALALLSLSVVALIDGGFLLLIAALTVVAIGQSLSASRVAPRLVLGLAALIAGHVLLIVLMVNQGGGLALSGWLLLQAAILVAAAALTSWLWLDLGKLRIPAAIYGGLAALSALLAVGLPSEVRLVTLGTLLVFTSEAILAVETFKLAPTHPARAWSGRLAWTLFWSGYAAVTAGFLYPRH